MWWEHKLQFWNTLGLLKSTLRFEPCRWFNINVLDDRVNIYGKKDLIKVYKIRICVFVNDILHSKDKNGTYFNIHIRHFADSRREVASVLQLKIFYIPNPDSF